MKNTTNTSEPAQSLGIVSGKDRPASGNEQLIEYHKVEGTPFTIARNGKEWFVLMGKYRLTEDVKTRRNAMQNALKMTWDRMMQVMQIMITDELNEREQQSKKPQPQTESSH